MEDKHGRMLSQALITIRPPKLLMTTEEHEAWCSQVAARFLELYWEDLHREDAEARDRVDLPSEC